MFWNAFLLALRDIRRNALRSFLTSLGIIIGVAAVITMVTMGNGATRKITSEIQSLGTNLLQVRLGQGFHGPGGVRQVVTSFSVKDAEAIAAEISGIEAVAPKAESLTQAIYGNQNWSTVVVGSNNGYKTVW